MNERPSTGGNDVAIYGGNHKRNNDAWSDAASCTGDKLKNGERLFLFEPIKGFAT
jgi:hypothetical protein